MQRISIGLAGMILPLLIATAGAARSDAEAVAHKVPVTRSERCSRLSREVDEAMEKHAKAMQAAEARALQKKADRLCAVGKQAQGIRTLAKALKALGAAPADPDQ